MLCEERKQWHYCHLSAVSVQNNRNIIQLNAVELLCIVMSHSTRWCCYFVHHLHVETSDSFTSTFFTLSDVKMPAVILILTSLTSASAERFILLTSTWTLSSQTSVSLIQRNIHTCCPWKTVSSVDRWSGTFSCPRMRWTLSSCRTLREKKRCSRSSDWPEGGGGGCDRELLYSLYDTVCAALVI